MTEVTIERLKKLIKERGNEVYDLSFQGWQIPVLYGVLKLATFEPGFDELPSQPKDFIRQASWWCEEKFRLWGLTPEEIESIKQLTSDGNGFWPEPE